MRPHLKKMMLEIGLGSASLDKGRFALDQDGSRRRVNTETGGALHFYPPLARVCDLTVLVHG